MQEPKFSILVANYNNSKFLDDLFLSFKEQTFNNYEVVFVDDCSSDDSLEIANNYALNDNRIRIYKNSKNLGCGKNKIRCIELAKGEICGFVDPDDILEPNALEVMINNFETNPDTALVYSNFYLCNEDLSKIEKYNYDSNIPKDKVLIYGATPNHFSAFKKEYYLKTSGINPNFKRAIDRDMVLKLEETGKTIHIPDYLYKYRINSNSISNNHNAFKAEYWAWQARIDSCKRRGWDTENIYSEIKQYFSSKEIYYDYRTTTDYKLGNILLAPLRFLKYKIFKKK